MLEKYQKHFVNRVWSSSAQHYNKQKERVANLSSPSTYTHTTPPVLKVNSESRLQPHMLITVTWIRTKKFLGIDKHGASDGYQAGSGLFFGVSLYTHKHTFFSSSLNEISQLIWRFFFPFWCSTGTVACKNSSCKPQPINTARLGSRNCTTDSKRKGGGDARINCDFSEMPAKH